MDRISLPQTCFDILSKEVALERVTGFEDLEHLKLANGEDGGSIQIYKGEKIEKVIMVEFEFNREGVPLPHLKNELALGAQCLTADAGIVSAGSGRLLPSAHLCDIMSPVVSST